MNNQLTKEQYNELPEAQKALYTTAHNGYEHFYVPVLIPLADVVSRIEEIIKSFNSGVIKDADKQMFGSEYTKGQNTAYRIGAKILTDLLTQLKTLAK